jgi:hypothetical protein
MPPKGFALRIPNKKTMPAVNAGSCGRRKRWSQPRFGNIIKSEGGSFLEMKGETLWDTAALQVHRVGAERATLGENRQAGGITDSEAMVFEVRV